MYLNGLGVDKVSYTQINTCICVDILETIGCIVPEMVLAHMLMKVAKLH